ncbi:MAG: N-6 DNA methylase [candidate division KSB1 bacterium]|nr:N-6 DNA methylase [candidate division KSB1 bacterium]
MQSLALAVLDEVDLDPPTWGKLKFPDLSKNIIETDFFKFITDNQKSDFDLVIGNPPFNLPKVNGKEPSRKKHFKQLKEDVGYESEIKIPDENPALHFLVQSMKLLKQDALLCLIQPSGPILYQKDQDFKQELFSQNNLIQVIDFTKLADKLWGRKNVATAAVFIQKTEPDNEDVLHLIANRTFSNANRLFIEFDYYDFHYANKDAVINNPYIWKANLFGGGRLVQLLERLSKVRRLGDFLNNKKGEGWIKGEGFIEKGDKNKAEYITGKAFLPTECLTENGIQIDTYPKCEIPFFHRPRKEELYTPPHLLIRKVLGRSSLLTEYSDEYLTFLSDIYSIHAPKKDRQELIKLADYIKEHDYLLRFFILVTSSRVKIIKSTSLYDEDILNIPYPENVKEVLLSEADKIILNDSMDYFLNSNSNNSIEKNASLSEIERYNNLFCKTLNSIYHTNKNFQLYKVIDAERYCALHFEYTNENLTPKQEVITDLEQYIENVIPTRDDNQQKTHIQRIIKAYGQDSIILAKPKQLRYWLPSIALRDADETFADYIKSRYYNA